MHEALTSTVLRHRESEACVFVTGHSGIGMTDTSLLQFWAGHEVLKGKTSCYSFGTLQNDI